MPPQMVSGDSTNDSDLALSDLLHEWSLLEVDFQRLYHVNLEAERHRMTYRHFLVLLGGLFGMEHSLTRHHFRPAKDEREKPENDSGATDE